MSRIHPPTMQIDAENKTITVSQNTGITLSVAFLLMIAGALVTATMWIESINNRMKLLETGAVDRTQRISELEESNNNNRVLFTEIQTQLKGIDTTLIEIRQKLR